MAQARMVWPEQMPRTFFGNVGCITIAALSAL
jgi:hypothetical protein